MEKFKSVILVLLSASILIMVSSVMSWAADSKKESATIKIGNMAPYSGVGQFYAGLLEKGIRAKLDEVGWKIGGQRIELIQADTAGDPVTGTDKAKKLVESDKVDVIIGPLFSHVAMGVASYLTRFRIPLITYTHPLAIVKMGGGNVFLPFGTMLANSDHLGSYVYKDLGYRTATLVFDDYVAGEDNTRGFVESFKKSGGEIVQIQRSPLRTIDYAPYISRMKKSDCVAIWFIAPEAPAFYKQYYEYGQKMPILYTQIDGLVENDLAQIGDRGLGTIGQGHYSDLINTDANKRWVKDYEKKYGSTPDHYVYMSYVCTSVFLEGLKLTKGDTTPEQINKALKKVKVDTPIGQVSFTDEGIGIGNTYIFNVVKKDNKYMLDVVQTYPQVVKKTPWD